MKTVPFSTLANEQRDYTDLPMIGLHCIQSNDEEAKIILSASERPLKFPPGSFVAGAIYPYSVKQFVSLGGAKFAVLYEQSFDLD